ncbi:MULTISPECIES: 5-methyltetrahydropteroyltriglutamate--homocysteine S-methyltransferase [Nitrosomonas]|uniref:5-methyltetrahydropteroyltriglutamate--homocysteine methyltransferase n=1 Tax=Nitrosomonas europaea (strain ATCC 19718 / CIP 103999 / KCTC 2705 / NBRC 14298) TaxID=228410 RepID=METE_NITEU|nr:MULTISPECIES: 5-methyltetrahydropteroyltriglutamate--homocysteine S-methyltransferase [Nitrosomonas]Q82UP6.1 RecName: Full=5-methyltetrahydropteroyltriglutamate--homocysteine methyltransferase; AltName: Full=Cobalamin-independent methionine synthase; AltName: Full=Methionine synthase, vitamin-B12 independent isozyme [Nitrosomonas europaea ATCC 19718]CAD85347.1 Methionine synthase, vitamin-B12 independent [Nitrosomonas europaea ATCC 19718]SDW10915.1 methionine synthase (B12-independent) [Nitro
MRTLTHNLGFPRIGAQRELKKALETYWKGQNDVDQLLATARAIRTGNWLLQQKAGIDLIPVGDFSLYDHILDMTTLLGAIPHRFGNTGDKISPDLYFAMARGTADQPAMEMTKWFNTNYHYIVPEFDDTTQFRLASDRLFQEIEDAKALGITAKAVLIGPLTYLYLGKEVTPGFQRLDLLPRLLPVYREILQKIASLGVEWVQIDEPILSLDLEQPWRDSFAEAYHTLHDGSCRLLLTTYFGTVDHHLTLLKNLPVDGLHIDVSSAPEQLESFLTEDFSGKTLSLGCIDGRNIWRADLSQKLETLSQAASRFAGELWIAPSCSLLHCPVDLALETKLEPEIKNWLAFSAQKLEEMTTLGRGLNQGRESVEAILTASDEARRSRTESSRIHNPIVHQRVDNLTERDSQRNHPFATRKHLQQQRFNLPLLPTTTIGSFPQTATIRQARAAFRKNELSHLEYLSAMRAEIREMIRKQEEIGLDVLVHGEPERNDMVEYFGEQLWGYAFTENGWVQSYGSRCVKPPILYGDVYRPEAMTVEWIKYAQSQTGKPVKGMLTGPVTMLMWSFVRDDQPRSTTALQLALAIRDEVADLENAGIGMIQIDEPAFREGLPLRKQDWKSYLDWAVKAFRVASSGVKDETQIHTHMCYSEFHDILPAIAELDADVITIETSRSRMELLDAFVKFSYPNEIGPGVYDIHSPRVPDASEMFELLKKASRYIDPTLLWVNPDCGLKTRNWPETQTALQKMVDCAKTLRSALQA